MPHPAEAPELGPPRYVRLGRYTLLAVRRTAGGTRDVRLYRCSPNQDPAIPDNFRPTHAGFRIFADALGPFMQALRDVEEP